MLEGTSRGPDIFISSTAAIFSSIPIGAKYVFLFLLVLFIFSARLLLSLQSFFCDLTRSSFKAERVSVSFVSLVELILFSASFGEERSSGGSFL